MPVGPRDVAFFDNVKVATQDVLQKLARWESERTSLNEPVLQRRSKPDLTKLFCMKAAKADRLSPYRYDEIAGLSELVDAVNARPNVRDKFALPNYQTDPCTDTVVLPREVATIPLVLAEEYRDRYGYEVATDRLLDVYEPYERYLLGRNEEDLRADIFIPILGANLVAADHPESACSIIGTDNSLKNIFLAVAAGSYDKRTMSQAKSVLLIKNAVVQVEGFGVFHFAKPGQYTVDQIERFFEALAITAPGSTTWVQYALQPIEWSATYTKPARRLQAAVLLRDFATRLDNVKRFGEYHAYDLDEDETRQVLINQERLRHCNKSIRAAAKRLARGRTRTDADDRIIDLCIGLEALLGAGFSETVHRLSMRASLILAQLWKEPSADNYRLTRDLYAIRSRLVHGDHKPYDEPMLKVGDYGIHATRFATAALASLLAYFITDDQFDPAKIDEQYVFAAFDATALQEDNSDPTLTERQEDAGSSKNGQS